MTRTSEVRPELFLATFRCLDCGTIARNVEQQFKFTQPLICRGNACGNRRAAPESALLLSGQGSINTLTTMLAKLWNFCFSALKAQRQFP